MTLFLTSGPEVEPVTLAEAKAHLRLSHDSEDELIGALLRTARAEVEAQTGAALIEQAWRLTLDRWPRHGRLAILRHPVRAITSVTVYGRDGTPAVLPAAAYQLDDVSRPARLHLEAPPAPGRAMNGIEVDFTAGFGESGTDVPDVLKRAILMLASHWFEFRSVFGADAQPVSTPPGFERLIAGHRIRRL